MTSRRPRRNPGHSSYEEKAILLTGVTFLVQVSLAELKAKQRKGVARVVLAKEPDPQTVFGVAKKTLIPIARKEGYIVTETEDTYVIELREVLRSEPLHDLKTLS